MNPQPPLWLTILASVLCCGAAFAILKFKERRASRSTSRQKSNGGGSFWYLALCAVVLVLALVSAAHRPANHRPGAEGDALKWSLVITATALGLLVAFYVLLKWFVARQEARHRKFQEIAAPRLVNATPPPDPPPSTARPLQWWVLGVLVSLVVLMIVGGQWLSDVLRRLNPALFVALPAVVIGGVVLLLVALVWVSSARQVRLSRKAFELANDGDIDGGIALLEAERQRRGDQNFLLNDLSVLYSQKKDWARALELIDAQMALTPQLPHIHSNRGLYLLRLGRLDDAEQAFRAAGPSLGDDPIYLCNYAELLLDLGRPNDAAQMVSQAQSVLESSRYLIHQDRQVRADEIYRLRMRLPHR